jgi:hypothetical protein
MKISELTIENNKVMIFKSLQYRWEETADLEREDVEYFLTLDKAKNAADLIKTNLGWHSIVEKLLLDYDEIQDAVLDEDFELNELIEKYKIYANHEEVYIAESNEGETIEGAIIIIWSWEKYIGYARNFKGLRHGRYKEVENDIFSNQDSTMKTYENVLLPVTEISEMNSEEIILAVENEMNSAFWKWNHFKPMPNREKIISELSLKIDED